MHKLAVALFYTCAAISIVFAAIIFVGKARAESHTPIEAQLHLPRPA
jgi:hypothetical protein